MALFDRKGVIKASKRIAILFLALLISCLLCGSAKAMESAVEYRSAKGTFVEKNYHKESDSYSMYIETEDGYLWYVNNYVHNLFEDCFVVFDTNGTDDPRDDIIISITIYSDFS